MSERSQVLDADSLMTGEAIANRPTIKSFNSNCSKCIPGWGNDATIDQDLGSSLYFENSTLEGWHAIKNATTATRNATN